MANDEAWLLAKVYADDGVLKIEAVRIYSESNPTLTGKMAYAKLLSAPGRSFSEAKKALMDAVKQRSLYEPWNSIYAQLKAQER